MALAYLNTGGQIQSQHGQLDSTSTGNAPYCTRFSHGSVDWQ